ncbi:TonB-dependent receptor [Rhodocytophaga aerolata]|uniref:TonB-dependent receptor n=1 Tax=Rhodocytophaga aerolata TaxID=455078 RepID=A0ABT8R1H6_9BACT|nr:TonB-dependent receptor [Rhodocytophaga aerolata]MDO1445937.1 TonB-dependent receptor [Rhodocytophaga aerolata]
MNSIYKSYTKLIRIAAIFLLLPQLINAQTIKGTVLDGSEPNTQIPLPGANVYWLGTTQGTITDSLGNFSLEQRDAASNLVISYVGFTGDTIQVNNTTQFYRISLAPQGSLNEVVVKSSPTYISRTETAKIETITTKELQKAACCNLSESFETNASVDVSYSDAVTGAKQVQMLGLDGTYVQINSENIPSIRGLSTTYGLSFVPGTWISAIDVGKGAGSVVNGYESIAGQINVELQKPETSDRLLLNTYINDMGRTELNLTLAHPFNKKWSTGLLLHGSRMGDELESKMDRNKDGFLDLPMSKQYNVVNRWKYNGERVQSQFGIKALYDSRKGGQMNYYQPEHQEMDTIPVDMDHGPGHEDMPNYYLQKKPYYGTSTETRRIEGFAKTALLFPETPYKGLGLILSGINHEQNSFFGYNTYNGKQQTVYANLIYQTIINNTNHGLKFGASYLLDSYNEQYRDSTFARTESVPGVFGEYTYTIPEKFTAVVGLRTDFHNMYGPIVTPRVHLKYNLTPQTTLRASAGSGFRVANPIAENTSVLISSRQLLVKGQLEPEKAWNYGVNLTHEFTILGKNGLLGVDLYRTDFINQIITDMDTDPRQIAFYNLDGKSYANSAQVELQYEPLKSLDVKMAYKYYDVKNTINGELLARQFVSRNRFFLNLGYATKFDKWKLDFTTQWHGAKRIPSTSANEEVYRRDSYSPAYLLFNAQVTRAFKKWDIYLGGENLGNFRQSNPIIAADQPFGPNFDASLIWGPVYGRMIYAGMRFKIK